jgi:DNA-binding SARP family transcriptional activator
VNRPVISQTSSVVDVSQRVDAQAPLLRVYTFGAFRLDWQVSPFTTEDVWKSRTSARTLFKLLLCAPGRQASRSQLAGILWPETDEDKARESLRSASKVLRKVLRTAIGEELLENRNNSTVLKLAEQSRLWIDVDAFEALVAQASRAVTPDEALALWLQAMNLLGGEFLADDQGSEWMGHRWIKLRRQALRMARSRMARHLADLSLQRGQVSLAEEVLQQHLLRFPTDQDALYQLLLLLEQQCCFEEARLLYEQTKRALEAIGKQPAKHLRTYYEHLQKLVLSPRQGTVEGIPSNLAQSPLVTVAGNPLSARGSPLTLPRIANIPLSAPSLLPIDADVLTRVATALDTPSHVGEREVAYLDQQTRLYWRAREESVLSASTLYAHVIRHSDDIATFLVRSLLPTIRLALCELVCRTVLLAGILLYDMGQYEQARQHYQLAFQAAAQANNRVLQALVWGWMSFTWTYAKQFADALLCVQQARFFAIQTHDLVVQAWLGAVEAEIQSHLHNQEACLQALRTMERAIGESPSQEISYLFEFNPALLLGYKGVCLQQFYRKQERATHFFLHESKEALELALSSNAPTKRKLYYLSDLAGAYAREGEVERACAFVGQTVPIIMQVGSGSKTIRQHLLEARSLLQPYEETSSVRSLDEQMAPLLAIKREEEQ